VDLLPANRHLNRGFGDTLSRAFEFAAVVAVFLGLGWLLDRWAGTQPLFMTLLVVFALIGQGVRLYYGYEHEMRKHDAERRARLAQRQDQ
jgi:F0F1-type ATP synthase assembly protein I